MRKRFLTPNSSDFNALGVGRFYVVPSPLLMYLSGAVQELCMSYNWEQHGTASPEETAQIFTELLDEPMTSPLGTIVFYATPTPTVSYILPCDGSTYLVEDYAELAASGAVVVSGLTFDTPDLRDVFLFGASPTKTLFSSGGVEKHTLTESEIPPHTHGYVPPVANVDLEAPGAPDILAAGVGVSAQTTATGNGQAHENMPPYVAVNVGIIAR